MNRNKLFAVLAAIFMLAVPLMVIDPDCFDSTGTSTGGNATKSTNDFTWTDVGDFATLKSKMSSNGGNLRLTANITSNGDTLEVSENVDVYVNLNGHTITFTGTPAGNPYAMTIKGSAVFVFGDDNGSKGQIVVGLPYNGISVEGKLVFDDMKMTDSSTSSDAAIVVNGGELEFDYAEITASKHVASIGETGGTITVNGGIYSAAEGTFYDCGKSGVHNLTINGGHINVTDATQGQYALIVDKTNDATEDLEQNILVRSGSFNGKVKSLSATTVIRGGIFEKDLDITDNDFKIFMGRFANDVSSFMDTEEEGKGSVWVTKETSHMTYNEVFQKDCCRVTVGETTTYYDDFRVAFESNNDGSTVEICRPGTYIMDFQYCHSTKIIGVVDGVILDCMDQPQYASGKDVYIENVTFKRENAAYLGFCQSVNETYVNVIFTSFLCVYASEKAIFNNCVFHQCLADVYSVQIYYGKHSEFNNCTFNCMGKAVLLYSDAPVTKAEIRQSSFYNCNFYDKGHVQNKAAIEIHTEWNGGSDYTWWEVNINSCSVSGFSKENFSKNNVWNAVNNRIGLSNTAIVNIDGAEEYPTPAKFTITLKSDDVTVKTFTDIKYGGAFTKIDVPTKTGYVFKGFFDETFTKQYFDESGNPLMTWDARANGTLYALWVINETHKITFDINGATGTAPGEMTVKVGEKSGTLPDSTGFELKGFDLVGWSDGCRTYAPGTQYLMGANDIQMKAVWASGYTPIQDEYVHNVTIQITDMNGICIPNVKVYVNGQYTGTTEDNGKLTMGDVRKGTSSLHLVSEPTLDKTLVCQFASDNETKVLSLEDFSVKTVVNNDLADTEVAVSGLDDIGKEYQKEAGDVNVTITLVVDNSEETVKKAADKIEQTKELTGKSDVVFYDISIYASLDDGQTETISSVDTLIEIVIPFNTSTMKGDYEICHCHTEESGEVTVTKLTKITSASEKAEYTYLVENNELHVFLKKFSEITINYTPSGYNGVTFDVNGGDKAAPSPLSYIEGQKFTLPSYDGTKGGVTFKGWECNGTTYKAGDTVTMSGSDMKFTAVWEDGPGPGPEPEPTKEKNLFLISLLVIIAILSAMEILYFARKH